MFYKSFQQLLLWSVICISPSIAIAAQTASEEVPKVSKTISYQKSQALDDATKKKMLKEAPSDITNPSLQKALTSNKVSIQHVSFDYSLYDATTDLISDFDYDGFYHRFAVTIDVDTVFDHATIYADFYLSYEGGPWIYYASSDHYDIYSNSAADSFTIETELADGYPTGYYDMRIKVYDSETDDYLLTYDNLNDSSLVSIPLEDSYRDDEYSNSTIETEVIITHGAGSINLLSLFMLCLLLGARQLKKIFCEKQPLEALK